MIPAKVIIKNMSMILMTLCSGLTYRGMTNRLEHAQQMNALVFDLDSVGKNELINLFSRIGKNLCSEHYHNLLL